MNFLTTPTRTANEGCRRWYPSNEARARAVNRVRSPFARGLTTLRKGHTVLFWVGIFLPLLWIVGALMHPTDSALAAEGPSAI